LDLDEKLVEEIVQFTCERSKGKAVNKALQEYLRRKKLDALWSMAGKMDLVDNWYELRHMEPR